MDVSFVVSGVITVGGCFPTSQCISNCTQFYSETLSQTLPFSMEIEHCKMSCCDTDLCNDVVNKEEESLATGKSIIFVEVLDQVVLKVVHLRRSPKEYVIKFPIFGEDVLIFSERRTLISTETEQAKIVEPFFIHFWWCFLFFLNFFIFPECGTQLESFTDFPEMTRVPFVQKTRITKEVARSNPTSPYVTLTDESFYSPFFHHPLFIVLGDVLQ